MMAHRCVMCWRLGGSPSWTRIELFVSRHRWNSGAFWRKSARWVSVIRPNLLRRDLWHLDLSFDYLVLRLSDSFHIQAFFKRGPSWCARCSRPRSRSTSSSGFAASNVQDREPVAPDAAGGAGIRDAAHFCEQPPAVVTVHPALLRRPA